MSTFSSPSWGMAGDGGHAATTLVFNVVAVCRRWRSVAMRTPSLWSNILLSYILVRYYLASQSPLSDPSLVFESFVKMCLARSASHPLDIDIRDTPDFGQFTYMTTTSDRWRKLTVHNRELAAMMESEAFKGLPLLRYLDVHGDIMGFDSASTSPQSQIILDLPQLATLHLSTCQVPTFAFKFSVPNVTHIDLFTWEGGLSEARSLLSGLPRLSHLSLQCMPNFGPPNPHTAESEPFDLPHLQKLALQSQSQLVWSILSQCRLPSLKHLRIEVQRPRRCMNSAEERDITSRIDTFLDRCPQLESLTTQFADFNHFKKILIATRPRFVAFGHEDQARADFQVKSVLQALIAGSDHTDQIAEFAIFDAGNREPARGSDFVEGIIHCLRDMCCGEPPIPQPSPSLRRIDVHSPSPIPEATEREIRNIHRMGLIPSSVNIQLHHSAQRDGHRCEVAEDKWSTSTGPVTPEWDSTHYPYSPS